KALWTVLGLIPVVLFITGAVMWWNRVLRPALQRQERELNPAATLEQVELEALPPLLGYGESSHETDNGPRNNSLRNSCNRRCETTAAAARALCDPVCAKHGASGAQTR